MKVKYIHTLSVVMSLWATAKLFLKSKKHCKKHLTGLLSLL
jgi:hypothetical protein